MNSFKFFQLIFFIVPSNLQYMNKNAVSLSYLEKKLKIKLHSCDNTAHIRGIEKSRS